MKVRLRKACPSCGIKDALYNTRLDPFKNGKERYYAYRNCMMCVREKARLRYRLKK